MGLTVRVSNPEVMDLLEIALHGRILTANSKAVKQEEDRLSFNFDPAWYRVEKTGAGSNEWAVFEPLGILSVEVRV